MSRVKAAWTRWRAVRPPDAEPMSARAAWIVLGVGIVLFTGAALLVHGGAPGWDAQVFRVLNEVPPGVADVLTPLSRLFLPLGIAVTVVAAAVFVVWRTHSLWPIAVCAAAAAVAWLLANIAKSVADRPRPYEVVSDAVLRQQPAHGTSFPSSHTAVTVAVVVSLCPYLPRKGAVAALVYAALVMWSRVYLGVHYPLDVIAGAGIGLAVGGVALLVNPRRRGLTLGRRPNHPDGSHPT